MGKNLIIVESPAKVKTIKKFLGSGYMVEASVGHIRDLPSRSLGVDEEHGFAPQYQIIEGKEKVVASLKNAASKANTVYLASDPDREGEAIAWHVAEILKDSAQDIRRIQFNEITARAVKEALANSRNLDKNLFDAQQARRVLDRLVGFKISPLLWKSVKRGISAGRVQSVALRLIVEREEARRVFKPEEYWLFKAFLSSSTPPEFRTDLWRIDGKKPSIPNEAEANKLEALMRSNPFSVHSVEEKNRKKNPSAPFTTSTLQQAANQRLGYSSKRTMNIAQKLYEGVELGERGTTALITYMRTDSVRIADEAVKAASDFIGRTYGSEYLAHGGKGRSFKTKASAQDAHEAIRPVDVNITPEELKGVIAPDQHALYSLIWTRFVASQMAEADIKDTIVLIDNGPAQWRAKGERILFPGFMHIMPQAARRANTNSTDADEAEPVSLPLLKAGDMLNLDKLTKEQKFTQPEPRFSEASLVKMLEELGIGRPSTYATIISTLEDRDYVTLEDKHFVPTDLGEVVCSQLRENFATLMDVGFTAKMEQSLDSVAEGKEDWVELMNQFAADFNPTLESARIQMSQRRAEPIEAGISCPRCGKPLLVKFGRNGQFLACSGYPSCEFTSDYARDESGHAYIPEKTKPVYEKVGTCPKCGNDLVLKKSRTGSRFISCIKYPECEYVAPFSTGVPCPKCGQGELVEKSSHRGKIFYSCSTYPKCDFAVWDFPVAESCQKCGSPILVRKHSSAKGDYLSCPSKTCRFTKPVDESKKGNA